MTQSRGGRKAAPTSVPVAKAEVQKVETKPVEANVETVPVAKAEVQADLLPQEAAPIVQDESTLDLGEAAADVSGEMQSDLADLAVGTPTYNITPLTVVVRSNYRHDIFEPQSRVNLASGQEVVIECESADIKARVVRNIKQLAALKRQPDALVIIHG